MELYPDAPIYTLFLDKDKMPQSFAKKKIFYPPFVNVFRKARKILLPWLPAIVESLPLENYDLVISSSSCVAKGGMINPNAVHICYLHSPMRYIWDQRKFYLDALGKIPLARAFFQSVSHKLRQWDQVSSTRVDHFIVNSTFVKRRVEKYYGRSATVIHPPCEVRGLASSHVPSEERRYFLAAGALVAYKRFDLAIAACEEAGVELVVAGSGPEEKRLKQLAGKNTRFMISPDKETWERLIKGAKALLFPGIEDFGIVAIEAIAAGTPVIAYKDGGALDFVQPGKTGTFFEEESAQSLGAAIQQFNHANFDMEAMKDFALQFSKDKFLAKFQSELGKILGARGAK
jgi:glycosyltransferase involved in cell wall biosynthesis